MAGFKGSLDLRHLDEAIKGKWFITIKPFVYISEDAERYEIPRGVLTDMASIPKGMRWLISRVGKHSKPAVLHDWLCKYKITDRKKADKLFLEAMKTKKVNWFKRRLMYGGVRAYSIVTFKK